MEPLREFFERLALEWDSSQPPDREKVLHQLLEPFDREISACDSILDVGTGTGMIIPVLKRRYPGGDVTSIDLAIEMLARAQRREPGARLVQADVHTLPFWDESFSAVICHNSFPHFTRKEAVLVELKRVLKPGGRLFILHDLSREKVNAIHQNARSKVIHQDTLPEGQAICQMLERTGFRPLCVEDNETHYVITAQVRPGGAE